MAPDYVKIAKAILEGILLALSVYRDGKDAKDHKDA